MSQQSLIPDLVPHQPTPGGRVIRPSASVISVLTKAFPGSVVEPSQAFELASPENPGLDVKATKSAGGCEQPVRLSGTVRSVDGNGEIVGVENDAHTYAACKTRRATRCEPCAKLYQHDARHIIGAGLKGGKGVTDDVLHRPALFITLTAPGFGDVHTANGAKCMPRRKPDVCQHGVSFVCWESHEKDDWRTGQPICPDCYDYDGAVLWNNAAPALWRVTRVNLDRALMTVLQRRVKHKTGKLIPRSKLKKNFATNYVKVAETQRRGLIHFHITLRLDGKHSRRVPFDANTLTKIVSHVVRRASVTRADGERISWGTQLDIDKLPVVSPDDDDETSEIPKARPKTRRQVTNYLAKYSTKGSDTDGKLDRRFRNYDELERLRVNDHIATMVRTSWMLNRKFKDAKLATWAHQLGYRGHFLTKSRGWSVTFGDLRQARKDHQEALRQASWDATKPESMIRRVADWKFTGTGYRSGIDDTFAEAVREDNKDKRRRSRRAA